MQVLHPAMQGVLEAATELLRAALSFSNSAGNWGTLHQHKKLPLARTCPITFSHAENMSCAFTAAPQE